VILGSWVGNARTVSAWGLFPALGVASLLGARVRLQLYQSADYATQVYDSGVLDVFAWTGSSWGTFAWGGTPWGCDATDLTARRSAIVRYFAPVVCGSFRLEITSSGAVDTPYIEASRFWLANYVEAPYNADYGALPQWPSGAEQQRTVGASLRRLVRSNWRELQFQTKFLTDADRATWSDLLYLCNPATEIVLSLFPGDADPRRERDFTVLGSLKDLNPMNWEKYNFHTARFAITES
jgi:hypothetical protein